jgi:hypothetical protein
VLWELEAVEVLELPVEVDVLDVVDTLGISI